jgi:hypothetical protein
MCCNLFRELVFYTEILISKWTENIVTCISVTVDGVRIGNRIYCTFIRLVTALHKLLSHRDSCPQYV